MEDIAEDVLTKLFRELRPEELAELAHLIVWVAAFAYIVVRVVPPILSFIRQWRRDSLELDIQRRELDERLTRRRSWRVSRDRRDPPDRNQPDGMERKRDE